MADTADLARFRKALGMRLAAIRHRKGLTQAEVRRRIRLTIEYISQVENGHRIPTIPTLRDWALNGLGVRLEQVFRDIR